MFERHQLLRTHVMALEEHLSKTLRQLSQAMEPGELNEGWVRVGDVHRSALDLQNKVDKFLAQIHAARTAVWCADQALHEARRAWLEEEEAARTRVLAADKE